MRKIFATLKGNVLLRPACLSCFFIATSSIPVAAKQSIYALQPILVTDAPVILRVYNTRTHKTIWTRNASAGIDGYAWSHDHQSLAVIWGERKASGPETTLRFTLWHVGQKLRTFTHLPQPMGQYPPTSFLYTESLVEMVWSRDQRQILLRTASSLGAAGNGMGNLWCINTRTFKAKLIVAGEINQARWITPHKVLYKELSGYRQNKAGEQVPIWLYNEVKI